MVLNNATSSTAPSVSVDSNAPQYTFGIGFDNLEPAPYTGAIGANYVPIDMNGDADDTKYSVLYHSKSLGVQTTDEALRAYNLALVFFFKHTELFGEGSLCEQMGVHFFERRNFFDITTETYHLHRTSVEDGAVLDASYWAVNKDLEYSTDNPVGYESEIRICTLPFYAYQKIVSDRFLLRHETLTNNMQEDSTVDTSLKYDSPFFRNNMVPTMSYYHDVNNYGNDELLNVFVCWYWSCQWLDSSR